MIKKQTTKKSVIEISGVHANTFVILGFAKQFAHDNPGLIGDIDAITEEMISSDYENLITVFKRHFGAYVEIT